MIAGTKRPGATEARNDSANEESAACAVMRLCDNTVASMFPPPLSGLKRIKAINVGLAYSGVSSLSRKNCARIQPVYQLFARAALQSHSCCEAAEAGVVADGVVGRVGVQVDQPGAAILVCAVQPFDG